MRVVPFVVGLSILTLTGVAWAGPLDQPAFTATPQELLAAAKTVAGLDADVVVLRDDISITYDDAGRAERRYRVVAAILKPSAVDSWGTLSVHWRPFYQDRPEIRARVITRDGSVAEIDPKLFHDAPTVSESPSVFSDRRELEAPLPRLAVGAVFEEEFVINDREPLLAAGTVDRMYVGRGVPVQATTITIDAPAKRPPTLVTRGFARPPTTRPTTRGGRTRWTYVLGATAPDEAYVPALPGEVTLYPYVGVATGKSWGAIASGYRQLVEAKLAEPIALPPDIKASTPRATVDRALAWLHAHVRYTGIELRDSAIIPFTPAETIKRGFGDCKDKATLLVALLRAAGITADVVLLSTGPGNDVDRGLPGLGPFDHAIVRARVDGKDVWIDATEDGLPAGQLPARDQGRLALVIAAGTSGLTSTPAPAPAENLVREVRTFTLSEVGWSKVREVTTEHGVYWNGHRSWIRDTKRADVTKSLGEYARRQYLGELASFAGDDPGDITRPFALVVNVEKATRAYTGRTEAEAYLFRTDTMSRLPDLFDTETTELDRQASERTHDYLWHIPHVYEIEHRLIVPAGHTPPPLTAASETRALGTMTLTTTRRLDGDALVITYRLDTGPRRITAAQLRATRAAVLALRKENAEHVVMPQTGAALLAAGKLDEAIAEYKRLIALHPREGLHHGQLAEVYSQAGAGAAARRSARRRVELEPGDADGHVVLALQLRRDSVGRDLGFDADRDGAIAAYRKALALDPTHLGALENLAWLLTVDRRGWPSMNRRDLLEATELWKRAKAVDDDPKYDAWIAMYTFDAGKFVEAEALAKNLPRSDEARGLQIAATALTRGAPAALTLSRSMASGAERERILTEARSRILRHRQYDLARAIHAELIASTAPVQNATFAAIKKTDLAALNPADPKTPLHVAMQYTMGFETTTTPWDPATGKLLLEGARQVSGMPFMQELREMPPALVHDLFAAMMILSVEGDARRGWRVTQNTGGARVHYYVRLHAGRAQIVGMAGVAGGLGNEIAARLAGKDLAGARRWIEWFAEDLERAPMPPPSGALAVGTLYRDEIAASADRAPRETLEVAAALLQVLNDDATAIPVLRRCPVKSEAVKKACTLGLLSLLQSQRAWKEAAVVAAAMPDEPDSLTFRARALAMAGRSAEAYAILDKAMTARPKDNDLVEKRAYLVLAVEGFARAEPWIERAAKHADASEAQLNGLAWTRAFHDTNMNRALEIARRGEQAQPQLSPGMANTLALIEAEAGHPHAAHAYLARSHPRLAHEPPIEDDWYVYGRIAEHLGLTDDAIAAYKRVGKQPEQVGVPTTAQFAERALKRLGASR